MVGARANGIGQVGLFDLQSKDLSKGSVGIDGEFVDKAAMAR